MVYGRCLYDIQRMSGWYLEVVYRYLNGAYIVFKGQIRTEQFRTIQFSTGQVSGHSNFGLVMSRSSQASLHSSWNLGQDMLGQLKSGQEKSCHDRLSHVWTVVKSAQVESGQVK